LYKLCNAPGGSDLLRQAGGGWIADRQPFDSLKKLL